jgi:hypothetical protein
MPGVLIGHKVKSPAEKDTKKKREKMREKSEGSLYWALYHVTIGVCDLEL